MSNTIRWKEVFRDADEVGSSEYRSLVELCADCAGISSFGGEVDAGEKLDEEQIDTIRGALNETITHAQETLAELAKVSPEEADSEIETSTLMTEEQIKGLRSVYEPQRGSSHAANATLRLLDEVSRLRKIAKASGMTF